jgi:hypothetical protein
MWYKEYRFQITVLPPWGRRGCEAEGKFVNQYSERPTYDIGEYPDQTVHIWLSFTVVNGKRELCENV